MPGNWWHGVLNLDDTIAITQNYANEANFEKVWVKTRSGRKKLSVHFLKQLKSHYPKLYQRAVELNERDNFVMWDEREEYKSFFTGDRQRLKVESSGSESKSDASESESSSSSAFSSTSTYGIVARMLNEKF